MIEVVTNKNLSEVLPLIRAYQEFYHVADISDAKNEIFFSQFGESNPAGCQFLYRDNGVVVGFATVYFSYASSIISKVAILNDLYTVKDVRGKGIGRKLVEHCHQFASIKGASRLQWVTDPENNDAQKLYDSMDISKSTWHFYAYNT
ncbi:GNAT family N-acetyltransferase [Colwellia echini]|uniref:GNAT family N-acetyltransferase n=1 Tax=Colwellia echini TaxID=1982103 RepID=A0ABY3MUD8_9GAMM|nr:GNAT family N-acetyltransferase [Colwellia echini]TYK64800.1 GNAT family N-acetyltransferase [Colwellia echini]